MRFFKHERTKIYETSISLSAYREFINQNIHLYINTTHDGIYAEWKVGRRTTLIANCKFLSGLDENTIEVTAKLKNVRFYQFIFASWLIMGSLWILFEPSTSTLTAFFFGLLVIVSHWSFAISNLNNLMEALAPPQSNSKIF